MAGRAGITLDLDRFDDVSRNDAAARESAARRANS